MSLAEIFPETPTRAARIIPMSLWPEEVRLHVRRRATSLQRALGKLEDLRERYIAELDAIDGDADFEPMLGSPEHQSQRRNEFFFRMYPWARGEGDEQEPEADLEPSLSTMAAAHSQAVNQTHWERVGDTGLEDLEDEHDDREPQCEDEGAQCEDEGHDSDREPNGDEEDFTQGVECKA